MIKLCPITAGDSQKLELLNAFFESADTSPPLWQPRKIHLTPDGFIDLVTLVVDNQENL